MALVRSRLAVFVFILGVAACSKQEPAPPSASVAPAADAERSLQPTPPSQISEEVTHSEPTSESAASTAWPDPDVEKQTLARELVQAREQMQAAPEGDEKQAGRDRIREIQRRMSQLSRYRAQPELTDLPEHWQQTYRVQRDAPEADLLVQVGDIDNLGFGWPAGFDPFSGESTPRHAYPWRPEADDPAGTDRVMVLSGMREYEKARHDGYSSNTSRPYNTPQPITIKFSLDGVELKAAALQLFVDDFQAEVFGNRFEVRLDGREAPDLAESINALRQTGPIGKLLTLQLLPEYNELLQDGELVVSIDDPHTNIGDGFSIDFARLLINPKQWQYVGTVSGVAQDKKTRKPLAGVLVTAGNVQRVETGADGRFELKGVPAGMVVTTGTHPEYIGDSQARDLEHGQSINVTLELEKNVNTSDALAQQLEAEGKVDLYGIYFDLDKDTLKAQSEGTLQQVRQLLLNRPTLKLVVAGHTDSEGAADYNVDLSRRRAAAVVSWLTSRDIAAERLVPQGMGESQPVADNATPAGRALNRRVEIKDSKRT